jgi:hypothetical protein
MQDLTPSRARSTTQDDDVDTVNPRFTDETR